jgi:hypothetical protein
VTTSRTAAVFRSEWTPQRLVWIGVAVSLIGTIMALLALASRRLRGRRLGRTEIDTVVDTAVDAVSSTPSAATTSRRLAATAIAIGLMIAVFVHPVAGVLAAIITAITTAVTMTATTMTATTVQRRVPAILDHLLVGLVALGYAYIIIQQTRYGTPEGFGWPGAYGKVHGIVLFSTVMFGLRLTRDRPPSSGTIPHS